MYTNQLILDKLNNKCYFCCDNNNNNNKSNLFSLVFGQ